MYWRFEFENFWEDVFKKWYIDFLSIYWFEDLRGFVILNLCFRWVKWEVE